MTLQEAFLMELWNQGYHADSLLCHSTNTWMVPITTCYWPFWISYGKTIQRVVFLQSLMSFKRDTCILLGIVRELIKNSLMIHSYGHLEHGCTQVSHSAKTFTDQLCIDMRCCLSDLLAVLQNCDGYTDSGKYKHAEPDDKLLLYISTTYNWYLVSKFTAVYCFLTSV